MSSYFIRIDGATDVRRRVLETSKACLHIMRSHQKLLKIRSEKQTMMKALRRELKELTLLLNRLEELSPTLTQAEMKQLVPQKGEPARKERLLPALPSLESTIKGKSAPKPVAKQRHVFTGLNTPMPIVRRQKTAPAPAPKPAMKKPDQTPAERIAEKLSDIERKLSGL